MGIQNNSFYDNFPIGKLNKHFASNAGLSNAYELDQPVLKNLINGANSILEIGAGEGRIIQGLIDRNYDGIIYGIERSKQFLNHLFKKYSNYNNIEIFERNILYEKLPNVDLGLFLWSGILDFKKEEQKILVKKLTNCCKSLVIDTPKLKAATNATEGNGQNLILKTDFGEIHGRIPLEIEINKWANSSRKEIRKIEYKTLNNRERIFYIID